MSEPSTPLLPALQRMNLESEMFAALSAFQHSAIGSAPVEPSLLAVLTRALPAFEAGFAYTAAHWHGELTVTLHYRGAELGSSAPAAVDSYSDTTARLLAGLLGIPLRELGDASEPEPLAVDEQTTAPDPDPVPEPVEAATEQQDAAAEPEDEEFDDLEPDDVTRPLSESEKATAVEMVKVLPVDQRKAFTKTFRDVFAVPADSKQIVPFITELRHLQFIDRFTVEASGGIAA